MVKGRIASTITTLITILSLSTATVYPNETSFSDQHLKLELKGNGLHLEARQIPLIDILKAISQQAQIVIVSNDPLEETVSISLQSQSVEETVERLLAKRNFAVFYDQQEDGSLIPSKIRVFGSKSLYTYMPGITNTLSINDNGNFYKQDSFEKEFGSSASLKKQLATVPDRSKPDLAPPIGGIRISMLEKNSVFEKIGLKENDLLISVNALPIHDTDSFLEAIISQSKQVRTIQIERWSPEGQIDPVYIELH